MPNVRFLGHFPVRQRKRAQNEEFLATHKKKVKDSDEEDMEDGEDGEEDMEKRA